MNAFRQIESGGDPNAQTGSYKGLYQLSEPEFSRYGGQGSIFDPAENTRIAKLKIADEANQLSQALGRPVTDAEVYLAHQQGVGGATAHLNNPDSPAWQSMAQTGEGRQKGEDWAKRAIWGNVPDQYKKQFGGVDNITSGQFASMWRDRYGRAAGQPATQPAPATPAAPASGLLAQSSAPAPGGLAPSPQAGGLLQAPVFPQQAPQQAAPADPSFFAQIPAEQAMQAPPIQFAQRRPVNLAALRNALAQRAPFFAKG